MTQSANDHLYSMRGLAAARAALSPGGVLAVWSQGPDRAFAKRLEKAGFSVEDRRVRAGGVHGGSRHVIWLGVPKREASILAARSIPSVRGMAECAHPKSRTDVRTCPVGRRATGWTTVPSAARAGRSAPAASRSAKRRASPSATRQGASATAARLDMAVSVEPGRSTTAIGVRSAIARQWRQR